MGVALSTIMGARKKGEGRRSGDGVSLVTW